MLAVLRGASTWLRCIISLLVLASFAACSAEDAAPDYRYRLTVEVDTPEGLKTGSSVIEVKQSLGLAGGSPGHSQIYRRARGEAVAVDLADGNTLFALLRSNDDIEWAETIAERVAPKIERTGGDPRFDRVLGLTQQTQVPRTFPPFGNAKPQTAYPMLVMFADLDDPTSVAQVDPDDLAASFGEGVSLKRITVELTDDPVTTGIEERLGWLSIKRGSIGLSPMEARRSGVDPKQLSSTVTGRDFQQGPRS